MTVALLKRGIAIEFAFFVLTDFAFIHRTSIVAAAAIVWIVVDIDALAVAFGLIVFANALFVLTDFAFIHRTSIVAAAAMIILGYIYTLIAAQLFAFLTYYRLACAFDTLLTIAAAVGCTCLFFAVGNAVVWPDIFVRDAASALAGFCFERILWALVVAVGSAVFIGIHIIRQIRTTSANARFDAVRIVRTPVVIQRATGNCK